MGVGGCLARRPGLWEHVASADDRLPRVTRPKCRFGLPSVHAAISLYLPCASENSCAHSDSRAGSTGERAGEGGRPLAPGGGRVSKRIRAMQNPRHFRVVIFSEWGGGFKSWILEARRAQIHPSPLGIYRLVIRFRHSLLLPSESEKICETQHSTHRYVGRGVPGWAGKGLSWEAGRPDPRPGPCSAPGPFLKNIILWNRK